jgi:hypothetical protein
VLPCKIKRQSDRKKTMTTKEKLIQKVENVSESLLAETLDFVLFLKSRYVEEEIITEEQENILSSQTIYLSSD